MRAATGTRSPSRTRCANASPRCSFPARSSSCTTRGPGARVTVPLLPLLLADLKARGYRSVTLAELGGAAPQDWSGLKRRGFLALDAVFDRLGHIHFAGGRADNLFRIARVPFPLEGARLADGTPIPHGASALEFHVNNPILVDLGPRASVRQARREDFRVVARELQTRPEYADVGYVFCLSAVSPLLGLLGFENHDLPPPTPAACVAGPTCCAAPTATTRTPRPQGSAC
ncbi:YkoP family protein [Deinococcus sp. PESE-38]